MYKYFVTSTSSNIVLEVLTQWVNPRGPERVNRAKKEEKEHF